MAPRVTMTPREYAEHRGCSVRTVQRAIAARKIGLTRGGRIDVEAADAEWAPVDPSAPRLGAAVRHEVAAAVSARGEVDELKRRLLAASAGEREWKEKLREMEYQLASRDSIPRAEVRAEGEALGAVLRASLLSLGARLSGALACACRDPGEVQRVVDAEVDEALKALQANRWTHEGA